LRAFEAVARLLSFRKAAEELCVTKSAVSHQVQALEDFLGVRLLSRGGREISLTKSGQAFLPEVQTALDRLAAAVTRLRPRASDRPLTISLLPTFAVRWLIPRLADFHRRHPEIDVRLDTSLEAVDFARTDVDVAVRYGRGDWPGLHRDRLLAESLLPVCSPSLLEGPVPLKRPQDLMRHTLLHNSSHPEEWRLWLTAAGVTGVDLDRGPSFAYSELLLRAAAEGLGVALARRHLIEADLAAGTLVAPFEFAYQRGCRYWLVCPPEALRDPRVAAFREWLLGQIDAPTR
jgi:LysR family glycine cleavage system transcriptional activator